MITKLGCLFAVIDRQACARGFLLEKELAGVLEFTRSA